MIWFLPCLEMWWDHLHVAKEICILSGRGSHFYFVVQFSSVAQSCPTLCIPWTAACQASLSITNSQSLLRLMSIELVHHSNHLILCHAFLLLPSIFSSIRVFSNELVLHIKWPKCWSFSFSISPSNEYSGLISFRIDRFILLYEESNMHSMTCKFSEQPRR